MTIPRTLTVDDNPPTGSIVVDGDGDAYQLGSQNKWHMDSMGVDTYSLSFLISNHGPITLLWEPPTTKDN